MFFTLSQAPHGRSKDARAIAAAHDRRPGLRSVVRTRSIATASLLMTCLACGPAQVKNPNDSNPSASTSTSASVTTAPFEWPENTNHPVLTLEISNDYASGTISIELLPELAPDTVAHVIKLAESQYYDGTTFHRVIPGFMIQGGDPNSRDRDPNNDGQGNPELSVHDEFSRAPFLRGVVGMGNKGGRNSTGGQFFIMQADNHSLDGRYTAIGRVISGLEIVDSIMQVPIDRIGRWGPKDRPIENVVMEHVLVRTQNADNQADADALAER